MSIIPDFVLSLVTTYLTSLLHWFSDRVYYDTRSGTVQELLGHKDVKATTIYTHVLNGDGLAAHAVGTVRWIDKTPFPA